MIKPLDFVHPVGQPQKVGLITEVGSFNNGAEEIWQASIAWVGSKESKVAWWLENEVIVIDSLPNVLTRKLAHPFGNNQDKANKFYPIKTDI